MRRHSLLLGLLVLPSLLAGAARGEILPVTDPFGRIGLLGFKAELAGFVTVPAEQGAAPTARPQYVAPVHDAAGRLFINDIRGVVYVTNQAGASPTPYLDLRTQGLNLYSPPPPLTDGFTGLAFHPNFAGDPGKPGYGVFYTRTVLDAPGAATTLGASNGGRPVQITEFTASDPGAATFSGSSRLVATLDSGTGSIGFNPTVDARSPDYGKLYIASAVASENDALQQGQDLGSDQGKILRIDPARGPNGEAFTVPADNPFVGQQGALPEIWALGLRNPQSFSWDSGTGTMYINDLGQSGIEEVNVGRPGANYGWSLREGVFATVYAYGYNPDNESIYPWPAGRDHSGLADPVGCYSHAEGYALGSGFLYRGGGIPQLSGMYVLADIVLGRVFAFDPAASSGGCGATLSELQLTMDGRDVNLSQEFGYSTFINGPRVDARLSLDNDGELLLALKANGQVYRLEAEPAAPIGEPGTLALLAGVAALGWGGRRVRRV